MKRKMTIADLLPSRSPDPMADSISLQLRVPADVARDFKRAALDHDLKLNAFLVYLFRDWQGRESGAVNEVPAEPEPIRPAPVPKPKLVMTTPKKRRTAR